MSFFNPFQTFLPELLFPNELFNVEEQLVNQDIHYDLSEIDTHYIIEMDVPGYSVEDIKIECLPDNVLSIHAEQNQKTNPDNNNSNDDSKGNKELTEKEKTGGKMDNKKPTRSEKKIIIKGRNYRKFNYSLKFPNLDDVVASFENGVLTIKIKKSKKSRRQIAISKL